MSRQAMQQALEALEILDGVMRRSQRTDAAVAALRAALAEPEQEPDGISWLKRDSGYFTAPTPQHDTDCHLQGICQRSGYSIAPAPRKPLELTDSEVDDLTMAIRNAYPLIETPFYVWCRHFSRAIIAEYERKNGIAGEQT